LALKMKIYPANTAILVEKVLRTTNKMEWLKNIEKMDIGSLTPTISNRLQPFHRSIMPHWFSKIYRLQAATGMDFKRQTRQRQRPAMPHTLLQNLNAAKSIWNDLNAARGCLALLSCWSLRMEQQRNNDDERMQWKAWRQKGYVPTLKFASLCQRLMRHQTSLTCEKLRIPTLIHNLGLNEVSSNVVNLGSWRQRIKK
jgi:hypothetical protein